MSFNLKKPVLLFLLIVGIFSGGKTVDMARASEDAGWEAVVNRNFGLGISLENANWEIFTNRSSVLAIEVSKDDETLWIGTAGGLERRDATTGQLLQVLTNLDGLPDNFVLSLVNDDNGGLWVGTREGGLVHRNSEGQWKIFNTENSGLPHNNVFALVNDDNGGVWVGTPDGLVHLNSRSEWRVFNTDNSDLPHNYVKALVSDGSGGIWTGGVGIAHLNSNGQGQGKVFNTGNSDLPLNGIYALASDNNGGLWVGTFESKDGDIEYGGLTHLSDNGQGKVFDTANSGLPHNGIYALVSDGNGGMWVGTVNGGLAHKSSRDQWTIFNKNNSNLPHNTVYAIFSDDNGGQWLGTDDGLAHKSGSDEWQVFEDDNSNLPDNIIQATVSDDNGGLWIGTRFGGLAHKNAAGEWQVFNTENSDLPSNDVNALLGDGNDGLWVGTFGGGLAHKSNTGKWKVFNELNSDLPENKINALVTDNGGGVWVATDGGGLAHLNSSTEWKDVFDSDNSDLPDNDINVLISDGSGGLWLGTNDGLAHLSSRKKLTVFNTDNSDLPANKVLALASDDHDGVWVGIFEGGLAHLNDNGRGEIFNTDNSNLPDNTIMGLVNDGRGGLWVGTLYGGLAHLSSEDEWLVFNTENSGIPTNILLTLMGDGNNGLWIGMSWGGGLAHLTFGQPLNGKRAAILIHPKIHGKAARKHLSNKKITGHIYHALSERHYTNREIYFLSYDAIDVDGDHIADRRVVDAPKGSHSITLEDVRQAFTWAKQQGTLSEPLLVVIVAEGSADGTLLLNPETKESLGASELKVLLDDYQEVTDNQVIIILEASYAGKFIPELATDQNRIIITSTDVAQPTQHTDVLGKDAFSWHYFKELRRGGNLWDAFHSVSGSLPQQTPQFEDNSRDGRLARAMCLNGCFAPSPDKTVYHNGDTVRITLRGFPRKIPYVGISLPDGSLFTLSKLNVFEPFDGTTLPPWQGEEKVVELEIVPELPRGEYGLYLLRVDEGIEPLKHQEFWELNIGSMKIE
ncbi:MAG: hypothetical protein DRR19_14765 [Candidatus Parabeggiatoa sp. nov. 1]|nr:MAG: hypothetical protein DRR19_14765 [Gammaproteobacteria bacterium]